MVVLNDKDVRQKTGGYPGAKKQPDGRGDGNG